MTMLQIQAMLEVASIRENHEYANQAELHDKKVKRRSYNSLKRFTPVSKQDKPSEEEYDKMKQNSLDFLRETKNALNR